MARTKRLAILAVTVLVLGGCGGSATPTPSGGTSEHPLVVATATSTSSQAPTASPSADLPSLASKYLALSATASTAVTKCNQDKVGAVGLTKLKQVALECLTAYSAWTESMKAVHWGPVQPQADKVIEAMDKIDGLAGLMANAASDATFQASYHQLPAATAALLVAADRLRAALGLPPALT